MPVTDVDGASTNKSFQLTVVPANDPPTLDPINDQTVIEDSGPHSVLLTGIGTGAFPGMELNRQPGTGHAVAELVS